MGFYHYFHLGENDIQLILIPNYEKQDNYQKLIYNEPDISVRNLIGFKLKPSDWNYSSNFNSSRSNNFYEFSNYFRDLLIGTYDKFHPYNSETPYSNPICKLTVKGLEQTFLVTPYAHEYAKRHYGVETFYGDDGSHCKSGMLLKDAHNEQTPTKLSERMFFEDYAPSDVINNGEAGSAFPRLSDAIMAILQDSGQFRVDWTKLRPSTWLNPEIFGYLPNISTHPFYDVFPEQDLDYNGRVGHNFKYYVKSFSADSVNGYKNEWYFELYNEHKNFYNPNNKPRIGVSPEADFMILKIPKWQCEDGYAHIDAANTDIPCSKYECANDNKSFVFHYLDDSTGKSTGSFTCTREGEEFIRPYNSNNVEYTCPDPVIFCKTVKIHDSYFTEDPLSTPAPTPLPTPQTTPSMTPRETPVETPSMTPQTTPVETPSTTPHKTPVETPSMTPQKTPVETPSTTPAATPLPTSTPEPSQTPLPTSTPAPSQNFHNAQLRRGLFGMERKTGIIILVGGILITLIIIAIIVIIVATIIFYKRGGENFSSEDLENADETRMYQNPYDNTADDLKI